MKLYSPSTQIFRRAIVLQLRFRKRLYQKTYIFLFSNATIDQYNHFLLKVKVAGHTNILFYFLLNEISPTIIIL